MPNAGALEAIADLGRSCIDAVHWAVVVAHPDDESIGCGALLARLRGVMIIVVTDGAPRDLKDARQHGFETAEDYAAHRWGELEEALAIGRVRVGRLIGLDLPDQQAAHGMASLTRRLVRHFSEGGVHVVLTHSYEGGHPDHDATCFAVHAACRMIGNGAPDIVEMPYYHGLTEFVAQHFLPGPKPLEIRLSDQAGRSKRSMLSAHLSQATTLAAFCCDAEWFRSAPDYDFTLLPNSGRLLYEQMGWGLTGREWLAEVRSAAAELGLAS